MRSALLLAVHLPSFTIVPNHTRSIFQGALKVFCGDGDPTFFDHFDDVRKVQIMERRDSPKKKVRRLPTRNPGHVKSPRSCAIHSGEV